MSFEQLGFRFGVARGARCVLALTLGTLALGCEPELGPDAGEPDATQGPGQQGEVNDAGVEITPRGEVRWQVVDSEGSWYCPEQQVSLPKESTMRVSDRESEGFACTEWAETCGRAGDPELSNIVYTFDSPDLRVQLTFKPEILRGYSVAAFRENWLQTNVTWRAATKAGYSLEFADLSPTAELEIVSYAAPMLRVRLKAQDVWSRNSVLRPATAPYVCVDQGPTGFPVGAMLCTEVPCSYRNQDGASPTLLSADLELPIQQPTP